MALNTLTWQRCLANLLPSGTIEITENGEGIDVAQYAYADVNVSGGSSDFTTAEVTLVSNYDDGGGGYFTICVSMFMTVDNESESTPYYIISNTAPEQASVILYKGDAYAEVYYGELGMSNLAIPTFEVSGNATVDGNAVFITGDCTITCTGEYGE